MENLASHRRSASESEVKPVVIIGDNFSGNGDLESNSGNSSDKNPSSDNIELRDLVPTDSSSKSEPQKRVPNSDRATGTDGKRIKRLLANRVSARRSRIRKLESMEKLQKEIDREEARLSILTPQVIRSEARCKLQFIKNLDMKEMVEAMEIQKAAKEAEYRALVKEKEVLDLIFKMWKEGKIKPAQ